MSGLTGDTDAMPDEIPGCCSDEWAASNSKRARKRETAAAITGVLLSALEETGLEGRSVLDVGCGTGQVARDAARIATSGSVLGVDLSTTFVRFSAAARLISTALSQCSSRRGVVS